MSQSDDFNPPATASGIRWEDYNGRLLLFTVKSVEKDINTAFGVKDAIKATVDVLDGPTAGEGYANALVFPRALQSQLSPSIGGRVLGRLTQGNAKSGQKPPWRLDEATEADKQVARAFIAEHDKPPF